MIKGIRVLVVFILVTIIVAFSCTFYNVDDRKESEKVFKEYINLLYTVKPRNDSNRNMTLERVYTEDFLKNVMTENAYHGLWKDQIPLVLTIMVNANKYNIKVKNIDIEKYHKNKDGTATYTYNVHLKIFYSLDKNYNEKKLKGRATLKRIKFKWKVIKDKRFNIEKILFN
ncbi:hypothetical protein NRP93_000588 [Clostridium botulinum]|nr:hypothetical protein [Clostridium botulinum]